ncbi:hypothetical protein FALBO_17308 [Fusarium albosuccineum]|uniref:Uncharacterized protein n=1 Tax=Fusarium albosuccineum TaxID=1237068 RepID=A0A8H4NR04_9HYPO|nr:hypothetical protein FALBO_17308 [Fusarium albosuccineum]
MSPAPSTAPEEAPVVAAKGPEGALLVELIIYNGDPVRDSWAYFIRSSSQPSVGVVIHAPGDVIEIRRHYNLAVASPVPVARIPLQWVDSRYIDEKVMLNDGNYKMEDTPVCVFEATVHRIKPVGVSSSTDEKNVSLSSQAFSGGWFRTE